MNHLAASMNTDSRMPEFCAWMHCVQANHSGLKQKSDIEHYRNKLRQKARKKGYGEFSLSERGSHGYSHRETRHTRHDNGVKEPMTAEEKRASFAGCHKRYEDQEIPEKQKWGKLSSENVILIGQEKRWKLVTNNIWYH